MTNFFSDEDGRDDGWKEGHQEVQGKSTIDPPGFSLTLILAVPAAPPTPPPYPHLPKKKNKTKKKKKKTPCPGPLKVSGKGPN